MHELACEQCKHCKKSVIADVINTDWNFYE